MSDLYGLYRAVPQELKDREQWVAWKAERGTKVPYNAHTGYHADATNPATWCAFATAVEALASDRYSGIGFVFSAEDPYTGIDLDDCISDDTMAAWAEGVLKANLSYAEVSPSGAGVKVFVRGGVPASVKMHGDKVPEAIKPKDAPGGIEIYSQARFFTVTGAHIEGTPTECRSVNGALTRLYTTLRPPAPEPTPQPRPQVAPRDYLERWAQHKKDVAYERVAAAMHGEKHNVRFAMARLLGGLIPHGLANADEIADLLFGANPPKDEAARAERKTLYDGAESGASVPLELPSEPPQPEFNSGGWACCPRHHTMLPRAANGNGYKCHQREGAGWCDFWWDGDGYTPPASVDPETGEVTTATPSTGTEAGAAVDYTSALLAAARSDTGNAECLALLHGDALRYDHTRRVWLVWDGARWAKDENGAAQRAMVATVRQRYQAGVAIDDGDARKKFAAWCIGCESASKIDAALKVAGTLTAFATTIAQYDTDQMAAATLGETLDLQAVARRPVRREDYLTMRLGAAYDPGADCPRWRQFLAELFPDDDALVAYLQRAVGYSLTGDTREQCMLLLHGGGANGKSTFLEILTALTGDYAGNASFETFDAARRSESTNDLAALRGKRFVTVIETEEGRRLAEARVKSVTGGDLITCRFLYGEYFSYRPEFKIWLAMNHLPVIRGADNGIWRRIHLIPFTQSFVGRENKTLKQTLRAELDGILGWALEGLRQWHERGLDPPAAVLRATNSYRAESDQIGRWLTDACVLVPQANISASGAYKAYTDWCTTNGEQPESQNKFGRRLIDKGFDRAKVHNVHTWMGFGLRANDGDDT